MPCDTRIARGMTLAERQEQVRRALKLLEQRLRERAVQIAISQSGAVAFTGWSGAERSDVTDVCAYRTLMAANSWELRQAVMRAEHMTGRKVDQRQVAAGTHSHDGGHTWHKGH